MKVVTAREMREIDRIAIEERGMPGPVLMCLAGKAVADDITNMFPGLKRVAVFSGTGNNGGDGFVAAYFLANRGIRADIFLAGEAGRIADDARVYFTLCKNSGITIIPVQGADDLNGIDLSVYECAVDALLGTGFAGTARGPAADIIRLINDSDLFVVSVDIPSALGADGIG